MSMARTLPDNTLAATPMAEAPLPNPGLTKTRLEAKVH
jgi:hypothetical protein